MSTELSAKTNLYTQGFSEGVQQIREKLSQLNTSLEENKRKLRAAAVYVIPNSAGGY